MTWMMGLSEQLNGIMTALDIGPDELARALSTNRRTVMRWLADTNFPQGASRKNLDEIEALVDRLDSSFKTREGAQAWLRTECGYFGGLRPIDALLRGASIASMRRSKLWIRGSSCSGSRRWRINRHPRGTR